MHAVRFQASLTNAYRCLEAKDNNNKLLYAHMAVVGHFLLMTPSKILPGRLAQMPEIIKYYRIKASRLQASLPAKYSYCWDFLMDCLLLGVAFPPESGLCCLSGSVFSFSFPFFSWESWPTKVKSFWLQVMLYILQVLAKVNWHQTSTNHQLVTSLTAAESKEVLSSPVI